MRAPYRLARLNDARLNVRRTRGKQNKNALLKLLHRPRVFEACLLTEVVKETHR